MMKNKYTLRIISGVFKGRGLVSPPDDFVRPTSGRVKEALFNRIRTELPGTDFLDLFAGTGQVGLEAVSLGARCVFADVSLGLVRENIRLLHCEENTRVLQGDFVQVLTQLTREGRTFDFIFADPPYQAGYYEEIVALSFAVLKENGVLILEHASDFTVEAPLFRLEDRRKYGSRSLTFLKEKKNETDDLSRQF